MILAEVGCLLGSLVILLIAFLVVGGAGSRMGAWGLLLGRPSTAVAIGLLRFMGLLAAVWILFVIGVLLCAQGIVPLASSEVVSQSRSRPA